MKVRPVVTTQWLEEQISRGALEDGNLKIVQANFPDHPYSPKMIPGSIVFNGELCCGPGPWDNMMPSPEQFALYIGGSLGITTRNHVVIYDASKLERGGLETAPRLWYEFRVMGHERVSVLEGGLEKWKNEGRSLGAKIADDQIAPKIYKPKKFIKEALVDFNEMNEIVDSSDCAVLDSRSESRFNGIAPEPAGGKSGRIRNTSNLPFPRLVDPATGALHSRAVLSSLFSSLGAAPTRPLLTTCGTGTTACALNLAWDFLGNGIGRLYDGSWYEYSRRTGVNSMDD